MVTAPSYLKSLLRLKLVMKRKGWVLYEDHTLTVGGYTVSKPRPNDDEPIEL